MSRQAGPRYPYAPLEVQVRARLADTPATDKCLDLTSDVRQAELLGTNRQQIARWRSYGVSALQADTLAQKIGLEPYLLWPDILDEALSELEKVCPECEGRFVPAWRGAKRRFCSDNCRQRWNTKRRYATDPTYRARRLSSSRRYKAEVRAIVARRSERSAA